MEEEEVGIETVRTDADEEHGPHLGVVNHPSSDISKPDHLGLPSEFSSSSAECTPSPGGEGSGLLTLPWEIMARIASHLPAQCVITVLPKVCQALGNLGKDSTAWQLRAHRLTGSRGGFPVGPREDFDWPTACLEMEQLITCWAHQSDCAAMEAQGQQRARGGQEPPDGENGEPGADGGNDAGNGEEEEGVGLPAQEVAFAEEGVREVPLNGEDGEVQPVRGGAREDLEERFEEAAAAAEALIEGVGAGAREERGLLDAIEGREEVAEGGQRQEGLADPRRHGDGGGDPVVEMEVEQDEPPRSPSPPPALERLSLPSGHIAEVNAVLLVGGEGAVCASGSRDRNVNLWDLREGSRGTLLCTLGGQGLFSTHRGWVWCLASQGPLLASGSFDSTVRLWDLEAGGAERGLIKARTAVLCLSCQTDVLLAGTYDKKVSIYDTRAAEPLVKSLRLHSDAVLCLGADDQYIISGSKDHTVAVYDRRAGKALQKLQLSSYLLSMAYNGSEVWAGDNRGTLHTFSMQSGVFKTLSQFDVGHTSLVTGIHRSLGSLYTCSSDRTIKVHLPCAPPRTLCTLHNQAGVNGLSVEAGVLAVASGDMCGGMVVWRARK